MCFKFLKKIDAPLAVSLTSIMLPRCLDETIESSLEYRQKSIGGHKS